MFHGDRDLLDRAGIAHALDVSEMTVRRHCEAAVVLTADRGAKMYDLDKAEELLKAAGVKRRRRATRDDPKSHRALTSARA